MINKFFTSLIITLMLATQAYSAGSSDSGSSKTRTQYDMALTHIKAAKKLEKKGKTMKANQKYEKAQKLLLKSNEKEPDNPDTLNYLGFTSRKIGDFVNGEKYYLQGLKIDPKHIGINEYLGELYVATNRMDLAKERLAILMNCNCKEYTDLKDIIDGVKESKY